MVMAEAGSREEGRNWGEIDDNLASIMLGVLSESKYRMATIGSWKRTGSKLCMKVYWHSGVRGVRDLLKSVAIKLVAVDMIV